MNRLAGGMVVLASFSALATPARAEDERAACLAAASSGQTLRDQHRLLEAREQFRRCAHRECPAVVQSDCATWLDAVERDLPTVVVSAKNAAGADVVDVVVRIDGKNVPVREGQALPIDPGPHVFHFEGPGGAKGDQNIVIMEGEHNRSVLLTLPAPPPSVGSGAGSAEAPADTGDAEKKRKTWRTIGLAVAGAGVVGLGIGTIAGVVAISDKNNANCDAAGYCDSGPLGSARSAATVADIGLVAGAVLVAGGVVLFLLAPKVAGSAHARGAPTAVGGRF
jgi:hypothetical protein